MYNYVPFTNINPTSTFLQRSVGSFQLTSAVYVLQELGEAAFSDVQKERDQAAIKHALDEYMSARNNATFIVPTRSDSTTTPTVTTAAFVDKHGTIRSQTISNKIRKHLHPILDTHNDIVNAAWEALAFPLLGFMVLCIIYKELTKSHEPSPKEVLETSSSSMVVKQLLKDRLSLPLRYEHQNVSVSSDKELPGLLSQLTTKLSGQFTSLESRLRDVSQSLDRIADSGFETIRQQLETISNKQSMPDSTVNDAFFPDTLSPLLQSLRTLIDVQKEISQKPDNSGSTDTSDIQAQLNETNSQVNGLEEDKADRGKFEYEIMQLKTDIEILKVKLQSCNDDSIKKRLQALEGQIPSLKSTTTNAPVDRDAIVKSIDEFRQKQDDLEEQLDMVMASNSTTKPTADEQDLGESFQRLDDRVSRMEKSLRKTETSSQDQSLKTEMDTNNNVHLAAIQNLEDRLKQAEDSHASRIEELRNRIYNRDGKFSINTKAKDISLEELAQLFKGFRNTTQSEMEWVTSRIISMADNSDKVSRMENITRDNSSNVSKCMKKLDIKFELPGADDTPDQPSPAPAQVSKATVKQEQNKPKKESTKTESSPVSPVASKGPTAGSSKKVEPSNSTQSHSPAESTSRTDLATSSWADYAKNTQKQEKIEADKQRAEEDSLRAQGKFIKPQLNVKETYIKGVPKDDEDYSQAEKTEHKIGGSSPSISGLNQSKWASPAPAKTSAPASKDTAIPGINQSKWASAAPESASTPASKDTGLSSINQSRRASPAPESASTPASKNTGVAGIHHSKWASPAPPPESTPVSKDTGISGINQSRWASPAPASASTPVSKNASDSKSKSWAETPPFTPTGSRPETPTTTESPNVPTGPRNPKKPSRRWRKGSSGLQGSIRAPTSTSDDPSQSGQSSPNVRAPSPVPRVRKETSASFSGFPKSEPTQSASGKGKGTVPSGLQESIHAQPSNDEPEPDKKKSNKSASPVENEGKPKPKEKGSIVSGINQSMWADK